MKFIDILNGTLPTPYPAEDEPFSTLGVLNGPKHVPRVGEGCVHRSFDKPAPVGYRFDERMICPACETDRPIDEFYARRGKTLQKTCKSCRRAALDVDRDRE